MSEPAPIYPPAERLSVVDDLHGHRVADPYRWLEPTDTPESVAWSQAEDALWSDWAAGHPERAALADRLAELVPAFRSAPVVVGSRVFDTRRPVGRNHAAIWVADDAGERVLVDPDELAPDGTTTLDGWSPSLEGDRLAYLVSSGGDEESSLTVLDVATGEVLDGPVDRLRYSPLAWLPGGEELLYVRRLAPGSVPTGEEQFHRRVWRHRIGTDPSEDVLLFGGEGHGPDVERTAYLGVDVSDDGRRAAVTVALGTAPRNELWLADLPADGAPASWAPALVDVDAQAGPQWDRRGGLWVLTDLDAPRRRLVRVDPDRPEAASWTTVLGEDPEGGVLEDVALAGGRIVALWSRHAVSALTVHDRDDGRLLHDVELPEPGTADLTGRRDESEEVWVGLTGWTSPYAVAVLDPAAGTLGPRAAPGAAAPRSGAVPPASGSGSAGAGPVHARVVRFASADGTEIRMTVLAPEEEPSASRPTILYGYGGFNQAMSPAYGTSIRAWVEAGGVYVVANLRGGAEEGEAWHRDGMRQHKHHVFEDFEAAADALVAGGWTTPDDLAISGGSNGGLLVGAALTRSPERYRAVLCSAPLLDMVRYELFGLGSTWNDEYGTAADPTELEWLLSYSPYHHVVEGTRYPAVLFTIFDSDTRVDPLHARKLAAALQWATSAPVADRPVLVRRERDVGHGARSVRRTVELGADGLVFLASQLGLEPGAAWHAGAS